MSYKFGKIPPRSLKSFGVSGVLKEECQIFFEGLFSGRHVGRVSDLLAARLESSGLDEINLRILITLTFFECYRVQVGKGAASMKLDEPLVLECGLDDEKLAFAVSFTLPDIKMVNMDGILDRVKTKKFSNEFERLLGEIERHSDKLLLRVQPKIKRFEVVALMGLPNKLNLAEDRDADLLSVVEIEGNPEATPAATLYTELGDLDYPKLLKDDNAGARAPKTSTGEMFTKIARDRLKADDQAAIQANDPEEDQSLLNALKNRNKSSEDTTRVEGAEGDGVDREKITVKGQAIDLAGDQTVQTVKGGVQKNDLTSKTTIVSSQSKENFSNKNEGQISQQSAAQIQALQKKIALLEAELNTRKTVITSGSPSPPEPVPSQTPTDWIKKNVIEKFWPLKKTGSQAPVPNPGTESLETKEQSPVGVTPSEVGDPEGSSIPAPGASGTVPGADATASTAQAATAVSEEDPNRIAKDLMLSVEAGSFNNLVKNAQTEVKTHTTGVAPKTQKWIEGLVGNLATEKSKMKDMAKKLSQGVRQKELELKTKEASYQEELARRDDQIKQKTNALTRAKDQISQMTLKLERFKGSHQSSAADTMFKKKFEITRGQLLTAQEESLNLKKKIEELKGSLVQSNRALEGAPSPEKIAEMKEQIEKSKKDAEEHRIQIQTFQEKLDKSVREAEANAVVAREMGERQKRAMEVAVRTKKELERQMQRSGQWEREIQRQRVRIEELESAVRAFSEPTAEQDPEPGAETPSESPEHPQKKGLFGRKKKAA